MTLEVVVAPLPYRRLAAKPFTLEWELAAVDGTPDGAPEDVSDVTGATVTAQLQVARGVDPPAAKVWTLDTGASLPIVSVDGVDTPVLTVSETEGLPAGTYDVIASFDREGGTDLVLMATLELTAQPA